MHPGPRQKQTDILESLRNSGYSDTEILEFIVNNYLSSSEATEALSAASTEFNCNN